MKNRFAGLMICISVVGALASAVTAHAQTTSSQWKQYSYPGEGFSVSSPTEPVFTRQDKPTATGTVEMHNYTIEMGNNSGVMISSAEISGADTVSPQTLLQGAKNGAIQTVNAKLTSEKEITLDGNPGIQFEAANDSFHVRARMYIVKTKLITVLEIAPVNIAISTNADRLCDSMRLGKAVPSAH
ncbi:MAG TPA: hypothetical protein VI636_17015 [Candidatus Angelobacter sp.]